MAPFEYGFCGFVSHDVALVGEHRVFAMEKFSKGSNSYVIARRQLCSHFNIQRISDGSSVNLIRSWVKRFTGATASAINNTRPGPSRSFKDP